MPTMPTFAVAPRLRGDPFDEVVAIPLSRAAAFRLADAARRPDDMNVSARNQKVGVAGFLRAGPERSPGRLRRNCLGDVGALDILIVDREREQRRQLFGRVGPIDVDADLHPVAHRNIDVCLADHPRICGGTVVLRRRRRARIHDSRVDDGGAHSLMSRWRPGPPAGGTGA